MSKEITNAVKYTERFSKDFQQFLTPDNTFYLNTKGETSTELSVHIPQYYTQIAGVSSNSDAVLDVVDYTQDDQVITQRRFRSKAMRVLDFEATFVSNDQRADLVKAMQGWVSTEIGNYVALMIAPATSTLFTSGTATRPSSLIGSGNTVKKAVKADWIAVRTEMAKSNIPGGRWFGLIDPSALSDLFEIDDFVKADATGEKLSRLMTGEFVDILGMTLMVRYPKFGANVAYTSGGTLADVYGAEYEGKTADTITSAHVGASIFWNDSAIYQNRGMAKTYITAGDARYQGDLFSMQHSLGCGKIRKDGVGVIALVEKK